VILVGQNLGLGEISTAADTIEAAAAGANITRIVSRWLGNEAGNGYGEGFQRDSFAEGFPHRVRPEYQEMLRTQLMTAKACKQTTVLAMDSDQLQGRMGGLDAWTASGQARRRQYIHLTHHYGRIFAGLVDYIEPIVEPQGPNVSQTGLWDYQQESMAAVLCVAPEMKFLIGGAPAYQPAYISHVFCPDWATGDLAGRITLTVNFGDDLVCDEARFEDRLGMVLGARDRWGVPVLVNQIWSDPPRDPDGAFLAARIRRLAGEGIGSIVWTACTRYAAGPGLHYLANPNDPGSEHVRHAARWAAVTSAWREANA
jgi:hypothetical protein